MPDPNVVLSWNDLNLEPVGDDDPLERFLGDIQIAGVMFRVEAIEVTLDEEDRQVALAPYLEDGFDALSLGAGTDNGFQLIEHDGREYALFVYPFDR